MKKQERERKMRQARNLYLQDMSKAEIARKIQVARETVIIWSKKGKWEEKRQEIIKKAEQKADTTLTEEKNRTLTIIKAIEGKFVEQLTNNVVEVKTSDFAQIQRVKWDLLMPKNISQYNFMKQGPTYTFEIINPNDNTNKVEAIKKATASIQDSDR